MTFIRDNKERLLKLSDGLDRVGKECILECVLDKETRTCEGCGRTLKEIAEAGRNAKCSELGDDRKFMII